MQFIYVYWYFIFPAYLLVLSVYLSWISFVCLNLQRADAVYAYLFIFLCSFDPNKYTIFFSISSLHLIWWYCVKPFEKMNYKCPLNGNQSSVDWQHCTKWFDKCWFGDRWRHHCALCPVRDFFSIIPSDTRVKD